MNIPTPIVLIIAVGVVFMSVLSDYKSHATVDAFIAAGDRFTADDGFSLWMKVTEIEARISAVENTCIAEHYKE